MAFYRLRFAFFEGSGTITVNGVEPELFYEEAQLLTIACVLDPGYTAIKWFRSGVEIANTTSFLFTMPSSDVRIGAEATGAFIPISDYGLKYSNSFIQNFTGGKCIGLEIYKFGYSGTSTNIKLESINYTFGNFGDDPLKTLVGSKIDFVVAGQKNEFEEFLEGDNRTWKVLLKEGTNIFFTGFISIDFLQTRDLSGVRLQKFTATDGFKSFESTTVNAFIFPGSILGNALGGLVGALNQSFKNFRPVNIICDFFEARMDPLLGMFQQFNLPNAAYWNDGEREKFTDDGGSIQNDQLYISETLKRLLNPFLCRAYIYDNEFWVVRTTDLRKSETKVIKYNTDATFNSTFQIENDLEIDCIINEPERTSRRVFTEFTAKLKIGVLFNETKGAVYEAKFETDEWFVQNSSQPYPGRFTLIYWQYINARPTNQPSSIPTGDEALIQFAEDACKIWTTSTSAGKNDTKLSFVRLNTDSAGRPIGVATEIANKISVSFTYKVQDVFEPANTFLSHNIGFVLKVGDKYLKRLGFTGFEWVFDFNIVEFTVLSVNRKNTINIPNLDVPITGEVEFRFYQLILNANVDRHRYAVVFDDLKINIEQNSALQLNEISTKAVTESPYSYVFPEYETFIGDTITNLSASAIRLGTNNLVSIAWTRDGVEELPLLDVITIELANLFGFRNRRIIGTLERVKPYPYQSVQYDGSLWMVVAIEWDTFRDKWKVELFELGLIETT